MAQNLGDEKVLAIPALFACYETKPNALACARNEKVACSSQVTSSRIYPRSHDGFGDFTVFSELFENSGFHRLALCLTFA